MPSTEEILAERAKTHGEYSTTARVIQELKYVAESGPMWHTLTHTQRESVHMILHKVGRVVSGNPNIRDHWDDIAGYAKLTSDRIAIAPAGTQETLSTLQSNLERLADTD